MPISTTAQPALIFRAVMGVDTVVGKAASLNNELAKLVGKVSNGAGGSALIELARKETAPIEREMAGKLNELESKHDSLSDKHRMLSTLLKSAQSKKGETVYLRSKMEEGHLKSFVAERNGVFSTGFKKARIDLIGVGYNVGTSNIVNRQDMIKTAESALKACNIAIQKVADQHSSLLDKANVLSELKGELGLS
jgi:hypothetical protein